MRELESYFDNFKNCLSHIIFVVVGFLPLLSIISMSPLKFWPHHTAGRMRSSPPSSSV
jgi:hypothetical protein